MNDLRESLAEALQIAWAKYLNFTAGLVPNGTRKQLAALLTFIPEPLFSDLRGKRTGEERRKIVSRRQHDSGVLYSNRVAVQERRRKADRRTGTTNVPWKGRLRVESCGTWYAIHDDNPNNRPGTKGHCCIAKSQATSELDAIADICNRSAHGSGADDHKKEELGWNPHSSAPGEW